MSFTDSEKNKYLRYALFFGFSFIFGVIVYLSLLSQSLVNTLDGLWSSNYYLSHSWELSIGRWLWLFLDRFRGGISCNPINGYLTILLISAGNTFLADSFSMVNKRGLLLSAIILSSTTICSFLSYRYMSPVFGGSFCLAVICSWAIIKIEKQTWKYLISAASLCLSLGLYQANIACTCTILLVYFIFLCAKAEENRLMRSYVLDCIIVIAAGCIAYKIIWDIFMAYFHLEASEYNGADSVSLRNMLNSLPSSLARTYGYFADYFFSNSWVKHSLLQYAPVFVLLFLFTIGTIVIFSVRKSGWKWNTLLVILSLLVVPIVSNISILLAPEADYLIQQTGGMAILLPVLLMAVFALLDYQGIRINSALPLTAAILSVLVLYGNAYATATDLDAMSEGRKSSESIMNLVVGMLGIDEEDLLDSSKEYYFIGTIDENPLFNVSELWYRANDYAQFGRFKNTSYSMRVSYGGVLREMGINCAIGPDELYYPIIYSEDFQKLNVFPSSESVMVSDNYVIVKMSQNY